MKIWQKHLFSKLTKTFLFLLLTFFLLYLFVDLSVHGVRFFAKSNLLDVIFYYLYTFSTLFELFVTLAFLLATMRVLIDLNTSREMVALQMAALSKKKLLIPFFLFATFLTLASYVNCELFLPKAQEITSNFKTTHKHKKKREEKIHVHSRVLKDETEIVYHRFNLETNELFDVYWIKSPTDIWHMKSLNIKTLQANFANHLVRVEGSFKNEARFASKDFSDLLWDDATLIEQFTPFENRQLSTLLLQATIASNERLSILSHLYYKLLAPMLPFLVLLAIGPFCVQFARNQPFFLIGALAIFGFIALKVILDGMLILGENQVVAPSLAIFSPFILILLATLPKFLRMR